MEIIEIRAPRPIVDDKPGVGYTDEAWVKVKTTNGNEFLIIVEYEYEPKRGPITSYVHTWVDPADLLRAMLSSDEEKMLRDEVASMVSLREYDLINKDKT